MRLINNKFYLLLIELSVPISQNAKFDEKERRRVSAEQVKKPTQPDSPAKTIRYYFRLI